MSSKPRIIITIGDPAGVGPEVTFKALDYFAARKWAHFIIIGDHKALGFPGKLPKHIEFLDQNNLHNRIYSARVDSEYGKASMQYIKKAVQLILNNRADCLVTAPVNKESINLAGYNVSGHTEYLARLSKTKDTVMLMVRDNFRVALVTRHMALKDVSKALSIEKIKKTICLADKGLRSYFKIESARIAVCGLNPHASDNGILGNEEIKIIAPAIKNTHLGNLYGPFPADTLFSLKNLEKFDCFIAMYHDQGLIPIKFQGLNRVVNCTLGLPFIRTSPGHGTAFDIAGKGKADPHSMIEAIRLAREFYYNSQCQ